MEYKVYSHGNVELKYYIGPGGGPSLLFLHGMCLSVFSFYTLFPFLNPYYRVFAIDLRGHGGSTHPGEYNINRYVADVVSFMQATFGEPITIIGHSFGGAIALKIAAEKSELCRSIAILDPPLFYESIDNPSYSIREQLKGAYDLASQSENPMQILNATGERSPAAGALAVRLSNIDPEVVTPIIDGSILDEYEPEELAKRIFCPTLLLYGNWNKGGIVPEEKATSFRNMLKLCFTQQIDCGHDFPFYKPVETSAYILQFLNIVYV